MYVSLFMFNSSFNRMILYRSLNSLLGALRGRRRQQHAQDPPLLAPQRRLELSLGGPEEKEVHLKW